MELSLLLALFFSRESVLFFLCFRSHHHKKAPHTTRRATPPATGPAIQALDGEELATSVLPVDVGVAEDVIDEAGVGG